MDWHNTITNIGIIGCGSILSAYVNGLARFGKRVRIVRCADVYVSLAETAAARYGIPHGGTVDELLADKTIGVLVNLTPPAAHADISKAAVSAGKHVYTEKPLSMDTNQAADLLACLKGTGLRLGSAPDTFLGSAGQTARAVIDSGEIGEPIGFTAFSTYSRAERWHPNPGFLFQPGAGPLLDVGPYFVAALINLLGPIAQVSGKTRIGVAPRRVPRENGTVTEIPVAVPTHAASVLTFTSGVVGSLVASFDIWDHELPTIEIYGTEGTLAVPMPIWFDGQVRVKLHDDADWRLVPGVIPSVQGEGKEGSRLRGMGILDLIDSLEGAPQRTNTEVAYHTLEVLEAVQVSSDTSEVLTLKSTCERPAPLTREQLASWSAMPTDAGR